MNQLFQECKNITEIDFSKFDSSKIEGMALTFKDCISLVSINFKNFNSSKVNDMQNMFENCRNLRSIDLSGLDTSNVFNMNDMFNGCINLQSLNLSTFNTSKVVNMGMMFNECINLITLDLSNFNMYSVSNTYRMFFNCNNITILNLSNFIITGSTNFDQISINYMKLKYIDIRKACFSNTNFFNNLFLTIPKDIIVCKDELDNNMDNLDNKCITHYCGNDLDIILKNVSDGNGGCYLSCDEGFLENNGKCYRNITKPTFDFIDSTSFSKKIDETNSLGIHSTNFEFIKNNSEITTLNDIKYSTDFMIDENNSSILIPKESHSYEVSKENINLTNIILKGDITTLLTYIDNEIFIEEVDNKKYQISKLSNQYKQNFSFIDLGECEDLLKSEYNTEELSIFKIENNILGINIPIIEYEIFSNNGTKLNIDICKNYSITYLIPVKINESEIFKYDPESNFYNNRCNKYTTENDTDMTLYDRKNEYNNNNLSLCEFNCTYKGYNSNTSRVECDCKINSGLNRLDSIQTDLLNKLQNQKTIMNFDVIQCSEIITSSEDLKSNPGFFSLIFILAIFIIVFIVFWVKGYNSLKDKIDNVIYERFKTKNKTNINKNNNITKSNKTNSSKLKNRNKNKRFKNKNDSLKELKSGKIKNDKNKTIKGILTDIKINKEEIQSKLHETDYELNNALYEDAKRFDKRSGCDYYCSLLKCKQIFIFTFLNFEDYNSGIIKKYIFFLLFALHYTINAMCFTDSNMHQIFIDQGNYNIKYQFKFIIISAILSTVLLRIILITLVLTDKNIFEIKCQPNKILANSLKKTTIKKWNFKFGFFFFLNLILLVLFWYYLTCWNAIYQNTQIYLIKNTLISFSISLIYPFVINIIPVILRKQALKKSKRECLYKTSKIMQLL